MPPSPVSAFVCVSTIRFESFCPTLTLSHAALIALERKQDATDALAEAKVELSRLRGEYFPTPCRIWYQFHMTASLIKSLVKRPESCRIVSLPGKCSCCTMDVFREIW